MSSVLYIRWEVRVAAELERQMQDQLEAERRRQAELFDRLLQQAHEQPVRVQAAAPAQGEAPAGISGFSGSDVLNAAITSPPGESVRLQALDWSDLLNLRPPDTDSDKKAAYAREIAQELALAPDADHREEKNRFAEYLNGLLLDPDVDFAYFRILADARFSRIRLRIPRAEQDAAQDDLPTYFALCELLHVAPRRLTGAALRVSIEELTARFGAKQRGEYVYRNLRAVLSDLNMRVVGEMELDGLAGERIIGSGIENCCVFMNADGDGILFETLSEADDLQQNSADGRARLEETARKVCDKHARIIELMEQRGISMRVECEERPQVDRIRSAKTAGARRRGKKGARARYMEE